MGDPGESQKQIFVAYSYNLYDKRDYRRVFAELEEAYGVKFIFADEKITNMHILQKIISYIRSSDFSIFDISGWNPNVTLELGVAVSHSDNWYIAFNPDNTPLKEVPSDIKGIDRIEYKSFTELEEKLTALMEQRYPKEVRRQPLDAYMNDLRGAILTLLNESPGLGMSDIAEILGVNVPLAQVVLRPMVGKELRIEGRRRGAKYFPASAETTQPRADWLDT